MRSSRLLAILHDSKHLMEGRLGTVLRGIILSYGGLIITGILGIINQSLILHQFIPEQYGEYSLLLSRLTFVGLLIGIGFDTWVLKDGGSDPERLADNVWQILLLKFAGIVLLIIGLSVGWINNVQYSAAFLLGLAGTACSSFMQTTYAALRARTRNGLVVIFQIAEAVVLLVALVLTQQTALTITLLMALRLFSTLIVLSLGIWQLVHICGTLDLHLNPIRAIRSVWLYVISDIFTQLYSQAPIIALGMVATTSTVGMFQPALGLVTMSYIVPTLGFMVALPLLSNRMITRQEFLRIVQTLAAGALVFGIACVIGIIIFGKYALQRLAGDAYADSSQYLLVFCLLPLLKSGSMIAAVVMIARNAVHLRVAAQLLVSLLCLLLCWLLIPAYSAAGAALVVMITEVCLLLLYTIVAYRSYRHRPFAPEGTL